MASSKEFGSARAEQSAAGFLFPEMQLRLSRGYRMDRLKGRIERSFTAQPVGDGFRTPMLVKKSFLAFVLLESGATLNGGALAAALAPGIRSWRLKSLAERRQAFARVPRSRWLSALAINLSR